MNNGKGGLPIVSILLSVGFVGIIMFVLFGVLNLTERPGGAGRIIFACVNCAILLGMSAGSKEIVRLSTFATLVQMWSVTVFYTLFQFGALFLGINSWYGRYYILYQLIIVFLYLCVALPVFNISYRQNNNNNNN